MKINMEMNLDTIYFNFIKDGKKIYETRIYDPKRQLIKLKEIVIFKDRNSNKKFKAMITELSWFKNFRDAIQDVGLKKVLPNVHSLDNGVKLYESFPHSEVTYKKAAKKYGVLRMRFNLLN